MPISAAEHIEILALAQWRAWLSNNHSKTNGVWCVTMKKAFASPYISYDELVEQGLCLGWVDSKPGKVDDERTKLYFAPRKAGSGWSKPNKERVEKLIASKQMHASGWKVIDAAKLDGSWTLLDAVEALETPPDLVNALKTYANATSNWQAFPRSAKRGILEWIVQAKTAPTRNKRIAETARLASENIRANQWTPKATSAP